MLHKPIRNNRTELHLFCITLRLKGSHSQHKVKYSGTHIRSPNNKYAVNLPIVIMC